MGEDKGPPPLKSGREADVAKAGKNFGDRCYSSSLQARPEETTISGSPKIKSGRINLRRERRSYSHLSRAHILGSKVQGGRGRGLRQVQQRKKGRPGTTKLHIKEKTWGEFPAPFRGRPPMSVKNPPHGEDKQHRRNPRGGSLDHKESLLKLLRRKRNHSPPGYLRRKQMVSYH